MRYFRTYPWGMQLLMFFLMVFTFLSSAGAIILGVFHKVTGYQYAQIADIKPGSPMALIKAALVAQGVYNAFIFMLPAIVFAYLAHPKPAGYLGLRAPGKPVQLLLTVLLMIGAMPVLILIENLVSLINFGPGLKAAKVAQETLMHSFMQMNGVGDFILVFLIMAVIPALGEEMFFRGTLMRFAKKKSSNMVFPILFTAAFFSLIHLNAYSSLSIFLAGILLAVIYNLTGSLWCSILGHLFFNGTQIVLYYLGTKNANIKAFIENNDIPYFYALGGLVLFCGAFYLLLKNKTPLPHNWADDFTQEELAQLRDERRNRLF